MLSEPLSALWQVSISRPLERYDDYDSMPPLNLRVTQDYKTIHRHLIFRSDSGLIRLMFSKGATGTV